MIRLNTLVFLVETRGKPSFAVEGFPSYREFCAVQSLCKDWNRNRGGFS